MRKLVSVCLIAAIVISVFTFTPIVSSAAEPAKLIDFYYEDLYNQHSPAGEVDCTVEWANNALHYTANTENSELGDTYFSVGGAGGFEAVTLFNFCLYFICFFSDKFNINHCYSPSI